MNDFFHIFYDYYHEYRVQFLGTGNKMKYPNLHIEIGIHIQIKLSLFLNDFNLSICIFQVYTNCKLTR